MTDATSGLPSRRPRTVLTQISPRAWEHAADRAALNALRSIPGVDDVIRKVYGFFGERGHPPALPGQRGARRAPRNSPRCTARTTTCSRPSTGSRAPSCSSPSHRSSMPGAFGHGQALHRPQLGRRRHARRRRAAHHHRPRAGPRDERARALPHHPRHPADGRTARPSFLAGVALLPIQIALLEWYRKSELSCDRAGLLASQDPVASMRMFMKMAGGNYSSEMDLDAFMVQAKGVRGRWRCRRCHRQDFQHTLDDPPLPHPARRRAPALGRAG